MKSLSSLLLSLIAAQQLSAQPTIEWQKTLGGSLYDGAAQVQATSDGGTVVFGSTISIDGDLTSPGKGLYDCWLVKLNSSGAIEWQKTYGGSSDEEAESICQTSDGGYIFAASSFSLDGDVTTHLGNRDAWIVKLSSTGLIEWEKTYGGVSSDRLSSIKQTADGGYILGGESNSSDGNLSVNKGSSDIWVLKMNSLGTVEWQSSRGGSGREYIKAVDVANDGGYIVAGYTDSNDGDFASPHANDEIWLAKYSATGTLEWQKYIGGSQGDFAWNVKHCADGGYIVAGSSNSADGDLTSNLGSEDCLIIKLNSAGTVEWQKSFGGSAYDSANSVYQTADGGFIVAASTNSADGDVASNLGNYDFWVVKLSAAGVIEWKKVMGGSANDVVFSIVLTTDGGVAVLGDSGSTDGDVTGNHGISDLWLVKLSSIQSVASLEEDRFSVFPIPSGNKLTVRNMSKGNQLKIQDLNGQTIHTQTIGSGETEISLSKKPAPGVYMLEILEGENLLGLRKIIIE